MVQNELSNPLPFEQRALVEALQRDMRNETDKAVTDREWADLHLLDAEEFLGVLGATPLK